jgi:TetR/AcrR family transcriptional regulator, regulator of cefoperazone and chloramphenicol sensitivity
MGASHSVARPLHDGAARTRERLLAVAEQLFAERGYRAASVRDITTAARCNLAAVTYHFGGKASLYGEVFRRRMRMLREQRIRGIRSALEEAGDRADLEMLLRAFTTAFLEPHLDESSGRRLMQLFSRELLDPHLQPGTLMDEMVVPVQETFVQAMRAVGAGVGLREARRCAQSVVAQIAHSIRTRGMLGSGRAATRHELSFPEIVDHIVRFSAAGIRACAGER